MIDEVIAFLSGRDATRSSASSSSACGRPPSAPVRGGGAHAQPADGGAPPQRAPGRGRRHRAPTTSSRSPSRATSPTCSCFPVRAGRHRGAPLALPRERRGRGRRTNCWRASCSTTTPRRSAIPPLICVQRAVEDAELLAGFLCQRRGANVELRVAERGEKRRVVELALRNAELALRHDVLRAERTRTRRIEALEELREYAQPRGAADAHRVLRHLEPRRDRTPWPRWSCSRTAPPSAPTTARSASGTAAARTTSARWRRP